MPKKGVEIRALDGTIYSGESLFLCNAAESVNPLTRIQLFYEVKNSAQIYVYVDTILLALAKILRCSGAASENKAAHFRCSYLVQKR